MAESRIAALIPPSHSSRIDTSDRALPPQAGDRSRLPLAALQDPPRASSLFYGIGELDASGRVSDRSAVWTLGWRPRTRVDMTVASGTAVVRAHPDGVFSLTGRGHVLIPAAVRHLLRWPTAMRLLLVAAPRRGELVIHSMSVLDSVFLQDDSPLGGGDRG